MERGRNWSDPLIVTGNSPVRACARVLVVAGVLVPGPFAGMF